MQTLYIDRKETRLEVDRERILVHAEHLPRPLSIAFQYLSSIVISAKTDLSSHLLLACAKHDVAVIILDARSYDFYAHYIPPSSGIVHRKLKQYALMGDIDCRLNYAKQLIFAQGLQQYKLLYFWHRQMWLKDDDCAQLHERLKNLLPLINDCQSVAELRGLEGATAKIVFAAISLIAPVWCKFTGRNRRPPLDPINVLLSLSYSLIYAECTRALYAHALDPMLGFYHEPVHGRHSLACDLTERLRTDVEKWVLHLVWSETLQSQHFSYSQQFPCTLNKEGRAIFYPVWERQFKAWKRYIRLNARQWAKTVDLA